MKSHNTQLIQEEQDQLRRGARVGDISPFRQYREQEGSRRLNMNGKPYTGIYEAIHNTTPEEFTQQQKLYNNLRTGLEKAHPLRQQHHKFNLAQVSTGNHPKLKTVNLRGGPNIAQEIEKGGAVKDDHYPTNFGIANALLGEINMNRLDPEQTIKEVNEYNTQAELARKRGEKDYFLTPIADADPIHTIIHEPTHINIETSEPSQLKPYYRTIYDFGKKSKEIPGIIHTNLHHYKPHQYPGEVAPFVSGEIDQTFPFRKYNKLAKYLEEIQKFYKAQGMERDFPDLYNKYSSIINQFRPDPKPEDLFNKHNSTDDVKWSPKREFKVEDYEDWDFSDNDEESKFANGGYVDNQDNNNLSVLAELLRRQGGDEDTVLAHINPLEEQLLKDLGGSGHPNPRTGLPQYGGWGSILGTALGAFAGGPLGAAAGAGIGSMVGGRKRKSRNQIDYEDAEGITRSLGGGGGDDEEPGFLSMLGSRSKDFLSDPQNLLSIGSALANAKRRPKKTRAKTRGEAGAEELEYLMASNFSPEELASRKKRYNNASRLTEDEIYDMMREKQMMERAEWEARNNLPRGGTLDIPPIFRKENDEEERKKRGRWFEYYNNPEFTGDQIYMKRGGHVEDRPVGIMEIMIQKQPKHLVDIETTKGDCGCHAKDDDYHNPIEGIMGLIKHLSGTGFIDGETGGQDDMVEARLSPGEYVIDAETVSHIGDGNSKNGAKKLDELIKNIRNHKRNVSDSDIAPKTLNLESYL